MSIKVQGPFNSLLGAASSCEKEDVALISAQGQITRPSFEGKKSWQSLNVKEEAEWYGRGCTPKKLGSSEQFLGKPTMLLATFEL